MVLWKWDLKTSKGACRVQSLGQCTEGRQRQEGRRLAGNWTVNPSSENRAPCLSVGLSCALQSDLTMVHMLQFIKRMSHLSEKKSLALLFLRSSKLMSQPPSNWALREVGFQNIFPAQALRSLPRNGAPAWMSQLVPCVRKGELLHISALFLQDFFLSTHSFK